MFDPENMNAHQSEQENDIEALYRGWFLEYASYVILERAVPKFEDGLKPVQRRILHSMREIEDARFHKVANIIGQTMQFHPHGDAAIGDALVNLGQKNLLIETQGNWGDIRTGDRAAAPRYIEARLTKFALEVLFNPELTQWQDSYDGRKQEPIALPAKFPLLLTQGVEGIAVGLATKIMPHNFCELIDASIDIIKGNEINIFPDFPGGGIADFSAYNGGMRGGKIRMRANIDIEDKKLIIRDIPYGTTSTNLVDSIIKANDSGKIKIKKVLDNTAEHVEIMVEIAANISPEVCRDALYAFTDCEISISPNCCVIYKGKPEFVSVNDVLKWSTDNTVKLLKKELIIQRKKLLEKKQKAILEKIFVEKKLYRKIEECQSWQAITQTIKESLLPYHNMLPRAVTGKDVEMLTELKIKRISRYDSERTLKIIDQLEKEEQKVEWQLENIKRYAIQYFRELKKKYGEGRERKTQIAEFGMIEVNKVAIANYKLYANFKEGFIGHGLKKDEYICDCSEFDDIIVFLRNGHFTVTRVSEKSFVGKEIIHVAVWKKGDKRMIYNMIYRDGKEYYYAKRFAVTAVTRDSDYDLTKGSSGSKVHYFTANANGESEIVDIRLSAKCRAINKNLEFDFSKVAIKGRTAQGNIVTKYPVSKIKQKESGSWAFEKLDVWYDAATGELNNEKRGKYLGKMDNENMLLLIDHDGNYRLELFETINQNIGNNLAVIEKYSPETVISAVHFDGSKQHYFVKRFTIEREIPGKQFCFISDDEKSRLVFVSTEKNPTIILEYEKKRPRERITEKIDIESFINIKGMKAIGNRLCFHQVISVVPAENSTENPEAKVMEEKKETPREKPKVVVKDNPPQRTSARFTQDTFLDL